MKKLISIPSALLFVFAFSLLLGASSCAQRNMAKNHCGTKGQKKQKYKAMKSGRAPGGGMLH